MSRSGIQRLAASDLEAVAMSYMETFNAPPWNDSWDIRTSLDRLTDLYNTPHSLGFCKWDNDKPVCCILGAGEQYFDGKVFRVIELWTDNAHKRKGYARALMTELADKLREKGYKRIYLLTMRDTSTLGFYESCGFEINENMTVLDLAL